MVPSRRSAGRRGVDFAVRDGGRVAVLGETGAGKSTLAHLLVRFWDPDDGRISLGGEDIRNLSEADIRRFVTAVSQQAHMFSASIRDNLLLGRPGAEEEELWDALNSAELFDFVQSLPGLIFNYSSTNRSVLM